MKSVLAEWDIKLYSRSLTCTTRTKPIHIAQCPRCGRFRDTGAQMEPVLGLRTPDHPSRRTWRPVTVTHAVELCVSLTWHRLHDIHWHDRKCPDFVTVHKIWVTAHHLRFVKEMSCWILLKHTRHTRCNRVKSTKVCADLLLLEMSNAEFDVVRLSSARSSDDTCNTSELLTCVYRLLYMYTVRLVAENTLVAHTQWSPVLNIWRNHRLPAGANFGKLRPCMHCPTMLDCSATKVWPYCARKTRMAFSKSSDVSSTETAAFIAPSFLRLQIFLRSPAHEHDGKRSSIHVTFCWFVHTHCRTRIDR